MIINVEGIDEKETINVKETMVRVVTINVYSKKGRKYW